MKNLFIQKITTERKYKKSSKRASLVFATFLLLNSCTPVAIPSYQMQQYPNINEKTLVVKKNTEEVDFVKMLKKEGATNIISSKGYINNAVISAVTADFMDYVYIFKDGKYIDRLEIKHDGEKPQVHPFAKIVYSKDTFGIFLAAENIEYKGKRVAQLIQVTKEGEIVHQAISIDEIIRENQGMYDPYVGGESLDTGIFLTGRANNGKPWSSAYKIKLVENELKVVGRVSASELGGCSCYFDWVMGKDAREVFRMKTE